MRHTHAPVDAALALRERLEASQLVEIAAVHVDTYQAALGLCDRPDPQTPYEASFSLQYCVASALLRGRVSLGDFAPSSLAEPAVRQLLARVKCVANARIEARYPVQWSARVELRLADGSSLETVVEAPRGDPENPLAATDVEAKFRGLAAHGGRVAGGSEAAAADAPDAEIWLDWVRGLGPGPLATEDPPWAMVACSGSGSPSSS